MKQSSIKICTMAMLFFLVITILPRLAMADEDSSPIVYEPKVKALDPADGSTAYNEQALYSRNIDGIQRYFFRTTFEDIDGNLRFDEEQGLNRLQSSQVYSIGQNQVSMIDAEFLSYILNLDDLEEKRDYISRYIFVRDSTRKEAHLYIPVKPLRSQTTYSVMINYGVVYWEAPGGEKNILNEPIFWSFTTTPVPIITGIQRGTVPEYYRPDIPILLKGDFFTRRVEVYFNDVRARRTRVIDDGEGGSMLEVYLPTGRNRLTPGLYTIYVYNDDDHSYEEFGALSVVEEGLFVPREDYKIKGEERIGEVRSSLHQSHDTLILDRRYTYDWLLEVDLDEVMGEEVVKRTIEFPEGESIFIGTLYTTSKWADIALQGLTRWGYGSDEARLHLGRVEPMMAQTLKSKLGRQGLKSDFIEVIGENLQAYSIEVALPYKESSGDNLKVLRYDPSSLEWEEVEIYFVELVDKRVCFTTTDFGIFAVVE